MNFLKELFSVKPKDVDKVAWSSLPADEKLIKLLKFTENQNAEVMIQAIGHLHPISQDIHDNSEERIITRLSELVLAGLGQNVKTKACDKIIELIRGSQSFGFVSNKYPMAVEAIVSQLKSSKEAADSTVEKLRMGTPKFHYMLRFCSFSDELISELGQYAKNKKNSNENRNGATILLGRLKDMRAKDFLQSLTNDTNEYIKINARQSLQQIEPADGFFSFSLDGWTIERYSDPKMDDFAKTTTINSEGNNLRLIYAFNLVPDKTTRGKWGLYGSWPCPNCGGSISFGLNNILNPEEGFAKGSCYPHQDYSIIIKYHKTENNGLINVPVLVFTNGAKLSGDYLLHFTNFQKYA